LTALPRASNLSSAQPLCRFEPRTDHDNICICHDNIWHLS